MDDNEGPTMGEIFAAAIRDNPDSVLVIQRVAYEDMLQTSRRIQAERDELRAEVERLTQDNAELSAECDQWGEKQAETWAEVEQLRAVARVHLDTGRMLAAERDELRAEVERLKTDPYKAGYIDGHHDAHARRNESYRDCPRCSFRHKE